MKGTAMLRRYQQGFTLVELMVTVAVMAVVASFVGPAFNNLLDTMRTRSVAANLNSALIQARSLAIKHNSRAVVEAKGGSWANGWQVYVDQDSSGGFNANDILAADQVELVGVSFENAPDSITYLRSGRVRSNIALPVSITVKGYRYATNNVASCIMTDASGRPHSKKVAC